MLVCEKLSGWIPQCYYMVARVLPKELLLNVVARVFLGGCQRVAMWFLTVFKKLEGQISCDFSLFKTHY